MLLPLKQFSHKVLRNGSVGFQLFTKGTLFQTKDNFDSEFPECFG